VGNHKTPSIRQPQSKRSKAVFQPLFNLLNHPQ
jgi:hypothetical protein